MAGRNRGYAPERNIRSVAAIALLSGLLAACDAGDDGDDGSSTGDTTGEVPTFTEVHERVLQPSCVFSTCHGEGASPAGDMSLDRDAAHASLVDVPSSAATGKTRVVPGDPDASYLMEKLISPTPVVGEMMPPDAPLEAARIELVRAWIDAGAADD